MAWTTLYLDDPVDRWIFAAYILFVVGLLCVGVFIGVENYRESRTPESQYLSQIDEKTDIDVEQDRDDLIALGDSACDGRLGTRFGWAAAIEMVVEESWIAEEADGGRGRLESRSLTVEEAEVLVDAAAEHLCA